MAKPNLRPDHNGTQRSAFESAKKKIKGGRTTLFWCEILKKQRKCFSFRCCKNG